jgi:hypothetical protein
MGKKRILLPTAGAAPVIEPVKAPEPVVVAGQPFVVVVTAEKIYAKSPGDGARVQLLAAVEEALRKMPGWDSEVPNPVTKREYKGGAFQLLCTAKILLRHSMGTVDTAHQIKLRAEKVIGEVERAVGKSGRGWHVSRAVGPGDFVFNLETCRNARLVQGKTETAFIHLPDAWEEFFLADIYGLDPQIRLIWDSLTSLVESDFQHRSHVCCYGQPGSGKTTVCNRFYEIISAHSPQGSILRFTASQTTKAGLENILIEAHPKPSLIVLEEIDKTPQDNVSALLDICNTDGLLRKANARDGMKEIPMQSLVICTVNNLIRFKGYHDGALASRFSQKVFFPRPNPEVLRLIALREIRKMKGDERWAKKALAQLASEGTNDPRRLRAILTSRKRLMDGTAIEDMTAMTKALHAESEELKAADEKRQKLHAKLDLSDG